MDREGPDVRGTRLRGRVGVGVVDRGVANQADAQLPQVRRAGRRSSGELRPLHRGQQGQHPRDQDPGGHRHIGPSGTDPVRDIARGSIGRRRWISIRRTVRRRRSGGGSGPSPSSSRRSRLRRSRLRESARSGVVRGHSLDAILVRFVHQAEGEIELFLRGHGTYSFMLRTAPGSPSPAAWRWRHEVEISPFPRGCRGPRRSRDTSGPGSRP